MTEGRNEVREYERPVNQANPRLLAMLPEVFQSTAVAVSSGGAADTGLEV
jgi:hypothetical protein